VLTTISGAMSRIVLGAILFFIVAYTIGYFIILFKKPVKEDGTPKTAFQVGSRILVLMIGISLFLFALFAAYTFVTYLFSQP
jgi:heme/copper-type cytochrome/quinol oxidase subunit 2